MNTSNSSSNPSDSMDGIMLSGGGANAALNFGLKDTRFDETSSSGLMFNTNQVNVTTNNSTSAPKEGGIGRMLTTLHLEWKKHETEKCRWSAEKAEYDAKIAILEGRLRSYANANNELLQRIKMLESALLVARSQEKFGNESILPKSTTIDDYQLPNVKSISIYTQEQSKRGRHLLQQYLKEINIIDEAIQSKSDSDSKIVEYLMRRSADDNSLSKFGLSSASNYASTANYSKTLDHLHNNKRSTAITTTNNITSTSKPFSVDECSQFLNDLKKGYKQSASDRQRDTSSIASPSSSSSSSSKPYSNLSTYGSGASNNNNFTFNLEDKSSSSIMDVQNSNDTANHLFDILNSLGSYSTQNDSQPLTIYDPTSPPPPQSQSQTMIGGDNLINSTNSISGGGAVVRKKDQSKKSSRMKLDMFNFNEDNLMSGTSCIPKKSEQPTTNISNIFTQSNNHSGTTTNNNYSLDGRRDEDDDADGSIGRNQKMNAAFESKLDLLAKRFNIGGGSGSELINTSTDDELTSLSSLTTTKSSNNNMMMLQGDNTISAATLSQDDTEIDLGFLNDIDSLISSQDDSTSLLNASNEEDIANDLKNTTASSVQKHWSINSVLRGHNDSITCVNLHPRDKIAVSSSLDGLVCLWYYNDNQKCDMYPTHFLRGHEYPVLYCLFNNIGDCLYTSDSHGNILVWNILNNTSLVCHYKSPQDEDDVIWYMNHSHSTNTLLSASAGGIVSLWKPDSTVPIDTFGITDSNGSNQMGVISADFSPLDPSKIIISAADTISLYDVNSHKNVLSLKLDANKYTPTAASSSGLIQSSSIHPSMNIYATGWGHNQVQIVDLASGEFVNSFIAHPAPITALSFGEGCSGTFLATAGANGSIHMWNSNYSCYQDVPPHRIKHHSGVNSLCFHSTFQHMVTGGADELVKLYI